MFHVLIEWKHARNRRDRRDIMLARKLYKMKGENYDGYAQRWKDRDVQDLIARIRKIYDYVDPDIIRNPKQLKNYLYIAGYTHVSELAESLFDYDFCKLHMCEGGAVYLLGAILSEN